MVIPLGMYRLAKVVYSEKAGIWALALGSFWYELIVAAPHGLTEFYTVDATFAALALFSIRAGNSRSACMGALLGVAFIFRPHNALPIAILSLFILSKLSKRSIIWMLAGGILMVLAGLAVDAFSWNGFGSTFLLYLRSIKFNGVAHSAQNPLWLHLVNLALCSSGLYLLIIGSAIHHFNKHVILLLFAIASILFFSLQEAQNHAYILVVVPIILCILADFLSVVRWRYYGIITSAVIVGVNILGFVGALSPLMIFIPQNQLIIRNNAFNYRDPFFETALVLSSLPGGSVLWAMGDAIATGGYFVFHHHCQMFYPSGVQAHAELLKDKDFHDFVRYLVVGINADVIPGFHLIKKVEFLKIFENDITPESKSLPGYHYEFQLPGDKAIIDILVDKKIIPKEPPLTPWNEGGK